MRTPFLLISLSLILVISDGCAPIEEIEPDPNNDFHVAGVKRRVPATPLPSGFMLYCQNRPRTANNPSIVLARNGEEAFVEGALSDINMQDVEKIEVLKSEAAVSRFGEKARQGVVVISIK